MILSSACPMSMLYSIFMWLLSKNPNNILSFLAIFYRVKFLLNHTCGKEIRHRVLEEVPWTRQFWPQREDSFFTGNLLWNYELAMASDKDVARPQCSEAVNHYWVTFACLGASLKKLNMKQEALSGFSASGRERDSSRSPQDSGFSVHFGSRFSRPTS